MSQDAAAWDLMIESMREFFRSVPPASDRGHVVELEGVTACVTPAVPERSLPNSVVYESEDHLIGALDELAAMYDERGVQAWTVWTPYYHERARAALSEAGNVLDASPEGMIAELDDIEPPREDDPKPDADPRAEDLGVINDMAYGTTDAFQRIVGSGALDPAHAYIAQVDGVAAASVVTKDHAGDCSVWWVATIPEARGRGLAAGLMRRALANARERGCKTTTLQATRAGRPVYERLGYRGLGAIEMWERRKPG